MCAVARLAYSFTSSSPRLSTAERLVKRVRILIWLSAPRVLFCCRQTGQAFRRAAARRPTFLLAQKRGPKMRQWRVGRAIEPHDYASWLRGLTTAHPCTDAKLARIHSGHPAGLFSANSPPRNGGGRSKARSTLRCVELPLRGGCFRLTRRFLSMGAHVDGGLTTLLDRSRESARCGVGSNRDCGLPGLLFVRWSLSMKFVTVLPMFLALLLGATVSFAQTIPVCPTSPIYAYLSPTGSPITDSDRIRFWIRQWADSGLWDFQPRNFVGAGSNITATASGVLGGAGFGQPAPVGVFGPLAAGTYTMTVFASATNVTPNVQCPPFVSQFVVHASAGAATSVPVPSVSIWSMCLLLFSLVLGGALFLRRFGPR